MKNICGVFDLFNVGQLNFFERCKGICNVLIGGKCYDEYENKINQKKPKYYNQEDRVRLIKSLKVVDCAEMVPILETENKG